MAEIIAFIVAILVMLVGVVGTLLPALPGIPLIWLAMAGYGLVEGFEKMTPTFLAIAALVAGASLVGEHYAKAWSASKFGAGKAGSWGAVIGSIVGLFFMPIGLFLGPFLGALLGELLAGRNTRDALRAGWGGLLGVLGSVLMNVLVAIGLVIAFLIQVL